MVRPAGIAIGTVKAPFQRGGNVLFASGGGPSSARRGARSLGGDTGTSSQKVYSCNTFPLQMLKLSAPQAQMFSPRGSIAPENHQKRAELYATRHISSTGPSAPNRQNAPTKPHCSGIIYNCSSTLTRRPAVCALNARLPRCVGQVAALLSGAALRSCCRWYSVAF